MRTKKTKRNNCKGRRDEGERDEIEEQGNGKIGRNGREQKTVENGERE